MQGEKYNPDGDHDKNKYKHHDYDSGGDVHASDDQGDGGEHGDGKGPLISGANDM